MDVPLVVFVNAKSGGLQGSKIIGKFKKCISPENVFDLSQGGPLPGLQKYSGQKYRIIICGGDGSVGWVLTEIDKLKLSRDLTPPVAILPIGTGNDLSRVLRWGGSHPGTKLKSFVKKVEKACVVLLDKWQLTYAGEGAMPHAQHFMNNYFSIGADAHIALQFHETRLAHPEKFSSRTQNMAWYVRLGLQNRSPALISSHVMVEINGKKVDLPDQTRCVVVLNLPSYSGGGNPWGTKKSTRHKYSSPAIDDGLLEVVAVNGPLQLVGIHANIIRGKRLGQGNLIKITTTKELAAQVDGEPWSQPPSVTTIQFSGKSRMLANSLPSSFASSSSSSSLTSSASTSSLTPTPSSSSSSSTSKPAKLTSSPSAISLRKDEKVLDSLVTRSMSVQVLMRTRTSTTPIVHTPSPINYGPVQPSKRKKGRLYCESCGLEFYLPYMLANHHSSGLCSSGGSSSVKVPSTPPPTLSIQIGDGAGTQVCESEEFRNRKLSDISDCAQQEEKKEEMKEEKQEEKQEEKKEEEAKEEKIEESIAEPKPVESQPENNTESQPEAQPDRSQEDQPEVQPQVQPEVQLEAQPEAQPEVQPEIKVEPEVEAQPESVSQSEPTHETSQQYDEQPSQDKPATDAEPVSAPVESVPVPTTELPTPTSEPTIAPTVASEEPIHEESKQEEAKVDVVSDL